MREVGAFSLKTPAIELHLGPEPQADDTHTEPEFDKALTKAEQFAQPFFNV